MDKFRGRDQERKSSRRWKRRFSAIEHCEGVRGSDSHKKSRSFTYEEQSDVSSNMSPDSGFVVSSMVQDDVTEHSPCTEPITVEEDGTTGVDTNFSPWSLDTCTTDSEQDIKDLILGFGTSTGRAGPIHIKADKPDAFPSDLYDPAFLENCLTDQFIIIKEDIEPSEITDLLQAEGIINDSDAERISETKHRREKCDILIKAIVKCLKTNKTIQKASEIILNAFQTNGYTHIFAEYKQNTEEQKQTDEEKQVSKDEINRKLEFNINELENEIDPLLIIDELVVERILTLPEHEDISRTDFNPNKIKSIIKYVQRKPENAFWSFCRVLDKYYPLLADKLRSGQGGHSVSELKSAPYIELEFQHYEKTMNENHTDRGETEVKLVFVGDGKGVEKMIVDGNSTDSNLQLQYEAMETSGFEIEDVQFSSIRIKLSGLSRCSQVEFLQKCNQSPSFLSGWIQSVLQEEHIKILKEKQIDTITFHIKISLPKFEDSSCRCSITKAIIQREITTLEKEIRNIDEIVTSFKTFEGFEEKTRQLFGKIPSKGKLQTKKFLGLLLDLEDGDIPFCLFEQEMRKTNAELLQRVTCKRTSLNEISITNIMANEAILLEELEPRLFQDMLMRMPGSEKVLEEILSSKPRRTRCKELIKFVVQGGGPSITYFVKEIERQKKTHILEKLKYADHDEETLKEAIIKHYIELVDEIEPRSMQHKFQESRQEIDKICKLPTRRLRAIRFIGFILKNSHYLCTPFMDSIEKSGYTHIVQLLKQELETYQECPKLYTALLGSQRRIDFTGEFKIRFIEEESKCDHLNVSDPIEASKAVTAKVFFFI